jgi:hypothetical protein
MIVLLIFHRIFEFWDFNVHDKAFIDCSDHWFIINIDVYSFTDKALLKGMHLCFILCDKIATKNYLTFYTIFMHTWLKFYFFFCLHYQTTESVANSFFYNEVFKASRILVLSVILLFVIITFLKISFIEIVSLGYLLFRNLLTAFLLQQWLI